MQEALKATSAYIDLMTRGAFAAGNPRDSRDCELKAESARWVQAYLAGGRMYGAPVTQAEAQAEAQRAWGEAVPPAVAAAISPPR